MVETYGMVLDPGDSNPDDVSPDTLTQSRVDELVDRLNGSDDWWEDAKAWPEVCGLVKDHPMMKDHVNLWGIHEKHKRRVTIYHTEYGEWRATGWSTASIGRIYR